MKRFLIILVVLVAAFIGAVTGVILTLRFVDRAPEYTSIEQHQNLTLAGMKPDSSRKISVGTNFEYAAKMITPAVVHISIVYGAGDFSLNPLELYRPQTHSSGSGVIISDDGYIVTNNHVIEDATNVEIEMNDNQSFYAKVVGRDPSTDLALLKIKAKNLPFIRYGNSDSVVPGEWVLAVGNPFDLNSTVTAGIVSAKARNIGILRDRNNLQVESFIQTDAAVNPGNSGGALVNLKGELVGINSAIATATGSYSGYSFAIPSNLVKKIVDDLLEFGKVQRGLLGVQIVDVTSRVAESEHLDVLRGIFVTRVNEGSAASSSGIEAGDVIVGIDGNPVGGVSELQEMVARHRPGHSIKVTYRRGGQEKTVSTILKNYEGISSIAREPVIYEMEGATLEDISYSELTKRSIDGGVLVRKLEVGKWKKSGMKENFIITHIDKVSIDNVTDLNRVMSYKDGGVLVEGIYKDGTKGVYGLEW
ncbi:MAG: PDZ domain-containing protein [Cyclobacteriaceae bacterium]|nr:PDZ domain-containing protein [Cyclobacteriaceae bacterium]